VERVGFGGLEVPRKSISQSSHSVQILIGLQFVRVCGSCLHTALGTAPSLRLECFPDKMN